MFTYSNDEAEVKDVFNKIDEENYEEFYFISPSD